jgi:hypothetical protein
MVVVEVRSIYLGDMIAFNSAGISLGTATFAQEDFLPFAELLRGNLLPGPCKVLVHLSL